MRKHIFATLLISLLAGGLFAQATDETIAAINARYDNIVEKARLCEADDDQGEFGELVMATLDVNARAHQWRAVGQYRPVYKFFYKQIGDNETRLYPDQLVFIVSERKVSDRVYREEYLYSDTGTLIFFRQKAENDATVPTERRVYFSGLKTLRIVEDGKARNRSTATDTKNIIEIRRAAGKLMDVFKRSIDL
ncbi:MAG: hypothetical protein KBD94_06750 [Pyrinomonadaceae bacterium]|nr:hypothetical protein [Pyrinomonadaceae bacterium]